MIKVKCARCLNVIEIRSGAVATLFCHACQVSNKVMFDKKVIRTCHVCGAKEEIKAGEKVLVYHQAKPNSPHHTLVSIEPAGKIKLKPVKKEIEEEPEEVDGVKEGDDDVKPKRRPTKRTIKK